MVRTAATDPWVGVAALTVMATLWWGISILRRISDRYDRMLVGLVGLIAMYQGFRYIFAPHGWAGFANAVGVIMCLAAMAMLRTLVRDRRQVELALRLAEARERPASNSARVEMATYTQAGITKIDVPRTILDSAPMPMFSVGLDGSINFWNTAAERVLGWSREEVLGHHMPHLIAKSTAGLYDGGPISLVNKDGAPIAGPVQSVPVRDTNGVVSGILTIVTPA